MKPMIVWFEYRIITTIKYWLHICQQPGCWYRPAVACYLHCWDRKPEEYFCPQHTHDAGYCFGCGQFWGGIENFDFGPGWCEYCASEFEEDEYDWDEYADAGLYYPGPWDN